MSDGKRKYSKIMQAVYSRPWAILPSMLAVIEEIVQLRAAGSPLTRDDIQARVSAAQNGPRQGAQGGSVAVIPIYGVLTKRAGLMSDMSGATSLEQITADFRGAMADPEVGAVVFDVDSPGGSVDGVTELAGEIRAARGRKPMVAVANTTMASAAYWLGSQADEVIAAPSAVVGSIGVIGAHTDLSAQDEMLGEKVTLITAGEGKANGNEHLPLTDDALAEMQGMADDFYSMFVGDVAAARGVKASKVTDTWKAGVFTAQKAKVAGLIDRIDTLETSVGRMVGKASRTLTAAGAVNSYLVASGGANFEASAIGRHKTATSDDAWDGPANEKRLPNERGPLRASHAWVDDDGDPDAKASYKFVHHHVSADGRVGAANLTACSTGIGVLNGGRNGTTIPDADKEGVHAHLGGHLRDAGRDVPPLRGEAPDQVISALLGHAGIVAQYAKKAALRAKEGRNAPTATDEQLAAIASLRSIQSDVDTDLDTDQPEEAAKTRKGWQNRTALALAEAAATSGYHLSE